MSFGAQYQKEFEKHAGIASTEPQALDEDETEKTPPAEDKTEKAPPAGEHI